MLSEVPEGWEETTFGKQIDFKGGNQPPKSTFVYQPTDGYIRLLQIRDFENDDKPAFIPVGATKVRCTKNDILIARYGASLGRICRGKEGAYNVALVKLILSDKLTNDFTYFWLNSEHFQNFLARVGSRSAQAGFNKDDLAPLPLFIPPLNEQHRIAEILSSVDASIQATQAVIGQAERVKRGLMEELLTGGLGSEAIERGEVPEGWALSSVSSVLKPSLFIDGDWVESKDQSPDGDVRLIQLADIGDGYFIDKSDRHLTKDTAMRLKCTFLRKGDILVARMPEPLGRCCFFPLEGEECFVTVVDVAIMRPHNSFNAMWLMNLINSDYARRFIEDNAGGTTRKRISRKNLGGLLLPVPPISEQCRIAEILSDSDNFIAKQKKTVEQLTRTKRGLMDDLLTGKVRAV